MTRAKFSVAGTVSTALPATLPRVNLAKYQMTTASTENGQYLASYATALQNNVLRNRYIPGRSDWANVIAAELGVNVSSVAINGRNNSNYFLDWKTNLLADYSEPSLAHAMDEADYITQRRIYLRALRRWLGRQPEPAPIGGAFYLFLRGMAMPGQGIVFDAGNE